MRPGGTAETVADVLMAQRSQVQILWALRTYGMIQIDADPPGAPDREDV